MRVVFHQFFVNMIIAGASIFLYLLLKQPKLLDLSAIFAYTGIAQAANPQGGETS